MSEPRALLEQLANVLPANDVELVSEPWNGTERVRAAPSTLEAWSEVMRLAARRGLRVTPEGRGTKAAWREPGAEPDLVLSTRRWTDVIAYEPSDGTLTARSGASLAALSDAAARGGHHVSPDVPEPDACSLGGVLGAGQSGFDRLRYGPARDQVLGMHVLLADGSVARSGGRLVKNVTGYDLHRLWIGSHGRLCVILDASLRLYPLPELQGFAVVAAPDADAAFARARAALEAPLRPWAVCAYDRNEAGAWRALAVLAGRKDVVRQEAELLRRLWPGAEIQLGDQADLMRRRSRDLERVEGAFPPLQLFARRSELAPLVARVERAASAVGLTPSFWCHPGIASASVWLGGERAHDPAALDALERALADAPGRRRWRAGSDELRAAAPEPGALLARRLEHALDPEGRFVRGAARG